MINYYSGRLSSFKVTGNKASCSKRVELNAIEACKAILPYTLSDKAQLYRLQAMSERQDDLQQDVYSARDIYKRSEKRVVQWLAKHARTEFGIDDSDPLLQPRINSQGKAGYPDLRRLSDRVLNHFQQQQHRPLDVDEAQYDVDLALEYRDRHVKFIVAGGGRSDSEHDDWIELLELVAGRISMMSKLPVAIEASNTSAGEATNKVSKSKKKKSKARKVVERPATSVREEPVFGRMRPQPRSHENLGGSTKNADKNQESDEQLPEEPVEAAQDLEQVEIFELVKASSEQEAAQSAWTIMNWIMLCLLVLILLVVIVILLIVAGQLRRFGI